MSDKERRKKKIAEKAQRKKALARKHEYPTFEYVIGDADPGFVNFIKEWVGKFRLS